MEVDPASSENDWHSSKKIHKRARYILEHPDEEIPSDISFLVGNGVKEPKKLFKCHRFVLALVSSMFQAMFYGTLPPPEPEEIVEIPDVTPTAFQNMLNYAYTDDICHISLGNCLETLYCAKKYLNPKLARACRLALESDIVCHGDPLKDCYFSLFQQAQRIDEDEIAEILLAEIRLHTNDALENQDFLKASLELVELLLEQDILCADEPTVYQEICRSSSAPGGIGKRRKGKLKKVSSASALTREHTGLRRICPAYLRMAFFLGTKKEISTVSCLPRPNLPFHSQQFPVYLPLKRRNYCYAHFSGAVYGDMQITLRPDLAPACCQYLQELAKGKYQLDFGHIRGSHATTYLPVPASVIEERNALSHSVTCAGAVWLEWGYKHPKSSLSENVRLAIWKKPDPNHTAALGYLTNSGSVFEKEFFHLDGLERLGLFDGGLIVDISVHDSS